MSEDKHFDDPVFCQETQKNPMHYVAHPEDDQQLVLFQMVLKCNHSVEGHQEFQRALDSFEQQKNSQSFENFEGSASPGSKSMESYNNMDSFSQPNEFLDLSEGSKSNNCGIKFSTEALEPPMMTKEKKYKVTEKEQNSSKKRKTKVKGDLRRNMYGNSAKWAIRAYCSKKYARKVQSLHQKLGIINSKEAIQAICNQQNNQICLGYIYDMFNCEIGSQTEKLFKKAFLCFYRWFMSKRFAGHVLQQDKILDKNIYLENNKALMYLPELTEKAKDKIQAFKEKRNHEDSEENSRQRVMNIGMDIEQ